MARVDVTTELQGRLTKVVRDRVSKKLVCHFEIEGEPLVELNKMLVAKMLRLDVYPYHKGSRGYNKTPAQMVKSCLYYISIANKKSMQTNYRELMDKCGLYTYILMDESNVKQFVASWGDCEIMNEVELASGNKVRQIKLYYHLQNLGTKAYCRLMNEILALMKQYELKPPSAKQLDKLLLKLESASGEMRGDINIE